MKATKVFLTLGSLTALVLLILFMQQTNESEDSSYATVVKDKVDVASIVESTTHVIEPKKQTLSGDDVAASCISVDDFARTKSGFELHQWYTSFGGTDYDSDYEGHAKEKLTTYHAYGNDILRKLADNGDEFAGLVLARKILDDVFSEDAESWRDKMVAEESIKKLEKSRTLLNESAVNGLYFGLLDAALSFGLERAILKKSGMLTDEKGNELAEEEVKYGQAIKLLISGIDENVFESHAQQISPSRIKRLAEEKVAEIDGIRQKRGMPVLRANVPQIYFEAKKIVCQ